MLLIGLTGGIASGKTLVSDHFISLGVPVIDADLLAREVVAPKSQGLAQLVDHFGSTILNNDKTLNRAELRSIIFSDPEHRTAIDGILHPLIRTISDQQIEAARAKGNAYAVYAIPLLVETGQQERFDRIVVVDVPTEVQITRLMERDESSREAAEAILKAQASREERLAIADDIVDNTGSKEEAIRKVALLHVSYLALAEKSD